MLCYGQLYTVTSSQGMFVLFMSNSTYYKRKTSLILVTDQWAWSLSRCTGSQPSSDVLSHPGGRLPLLSTRPAVTFPAEERHCPLTSTKLYCLIIDAGCEQLGQGCYAAAPSENQTHDLMITSRATVPPLL